MTTAASGGEAVAAGPGTWLAPRVAHKGETPGGEVATGGGWGYSEGVTADAALASGATGASASGGTAGAATRTGGLPGGEGAAVGAGGCSEGVTVDTAPAGGAPGARAKFAPRGQLFSLRALQGRVFL